MVSWQCPRCNATFYSAHEAPEQRYVTCPVCGYVRVLNPYYRVKFYIASGWENKEKVRELAKLLTSYGWVWSYDWTTCTENDDYRKIAVAEINAIKESDVVIVLLPGGRGTHIEMGAALAFGKPVVLLGDGTTLFMPKELLPPEYFHPKVRWGALPILPIAIKDLVREICRFVELEAVKQCVSL